jgi:hypothetical protein
MIRRKSKPSKPARYQENKCDVIFLFNFYFFSSKSNQMQMVEESEGFNGENFDVEVPDFQEAF